MQYNKKYNEELEKALEEFRVDRSDGKLIELLQRFYDLGLVKDPEVHFPLTGECICTK